MSAGYITALSPGEIQFIVDGIAQDVRTDGRSRFDYRPFTLETGLLSQTNGSARIVLDATDVLVGIKAEIGEPDKSTPNKGKINVSVECCPSASPEFEGRGASELNTELAAVIQRSLESSSGINLESLCLIPGKQCWIVYVDALVLDSAGNLFDALSIATRAALSNTTIPTVNVIRGDVSNNFELELDPDNTWAIPVENIPITVTLTRFGQYHLVDSTLEEELCHGARVTFALNKQGNLCAMYKGSAGVVSPAVVCHMIRDAKICGLQILERMDEFLKNEKSIKEKRGFFA